MSVTCAGRKSRSQESSETTIRAPINPTSTPPTRLRRKCSANPATLSCSRPSSHSRSAVKSVIAAASFSRLSPSTRRISRDGAPTSRKIAMTATGSVVATIAPSARHAMIDTPATGSSAAPIAPVATTTATIARSRIGAASSIICGTSIVSADSNSSAGSRMYRNASEPIGSPEKACATRPSRPPAAACCAIVVNVPSAIPAPASRTAGGSDSRPASRCIRLTRMRSPARTRRVIGRR